MDRFWSKVNKDGPTMSNMDTPCWEWTAAKQKNGYGIFFLDKKRRGALTHRVSALWAGIISDIDDGDCVCHSCDNPACVNPDHLWRGTHQENIEDMRKKGRSYSAKGELSPRAKLTEEEVRYIKNLLKAGANQTHIAKQFGVHAGTISKINIGTRWSHV